MQCVPKWLLEHLAFGWWKIKKYMSDIMSLDRYLTYVGYMSTKHLSMKVGMYVCLFHQIKIKSRQRCPAWRHTFKQLELDKNLWV